MRIGRATLGASALTVVAAVSFLRLAHPGRADGPRDNIPSQVRAIPPVGNDLEPADRDSLQADVDALGREIDALRDRLKENAPLLAYLPDVQIFYNAVQYPLAHRETIDPGMAARPLPTAWNARGRCGTGARHGQRLPGRGDMCRESTGRCSLTS